MRFAAQAWIIRIFLALPIMLLFMLISSWAQHKALNRLGETRLILHISRSGSRARIMLSRIFLLLGAVFCMLALARPQYGARTEEARQRGLDIVLAIDTSRSMLTPDVPPDRMRRARFELSRFFRESARADRVAIVPFAGRAHVLCPLTLDYGTALTFLEAVDVGIIPDLGTDIAEALRVSATVFDERRRTRARVIILLTDGEDHSGRVLEEARRLSERDIVVYAVGIGSVSGEPVPAGVSEDGEIIWHRDGEGRVVVSRLDQELLEKIVEITGGKAYYSGPGEFSMGEVYADLAELARDDFTARQITALEDRFQIPLAAGFLFLVAGYFLPLRPKHEREWTGRVS